MNDPLPPPLPAEPPLLPPPLPPLAPPPRRRFGMLVALGGAGLFGLALLVALAVVLASWWRTHRLAKQLMAYSDSGEYEAGLALADQELPKVRPNAAVYFALENLHYGVNNLAETKRYAQRTLELEPGNEMAVRLLISICRDFDDNEVGYQAGKKWIAKNTHGTDVYKDLALVADDAGHDEECLGFAEKAHRLKPENPRIASVYFYYAMQAHGAQETLLEVARWAANHEADEFFWAQIGKGLSEAGAFEAALPRLRRALDMGSDDTGVADEMMDCFRGLGDADGAERFLATHLRSHEPSDALWRMLGAIQYDAGNHGRALECFREAQRLEPASAVTMANVVFTLYELQRSTDAITEAEAWMAAGHEAPTALLHRALGNAYFARSRWPEAEGQYRAALALDPESFASARELVSTLTEAGRPADAVEFGTAWRAENPDAGEESFADALAKAQAQVDDLDTEAFRVESEDGDPGACGEMELKNETEEAEKGGLLRQPRPPAADATMEQPV